MDNLSQPIYPQPEETNSVLGQALSELPAGKTAVVSQLGGGREFMSRAVALGFTIGAQVTVVQNYGQGPMIVSLHHAHLALGRGEAVKILVQPL